LLQTTNICIFNAAELFYTLSILHLLKSRPRVTAALQTMLKHIFPAVAEHTNTK